MNVLKKILEEIEKESKLAHEEMGRCAKENPLQFDEAKGYARGCETILEIIRSHTENVDWIPVENRLPKVPEGTEDGYCPEFNVTIKGAVQATTLKFAPDGTWFDDLGEVYSVMAWQPLPEPYRPEE